MVEEREEKKRRKGVAKSEGGEMDGWRIFYTKTRGKRQREEEKGKKKRKEGGHCKGGWSWRRR